MKIDIKIDADKENGKIKFADVSFLMDRNDFLQDIKKLRNKWSDNKIIEYKNYDNWRKTKLRPTEKQKKEMVVAWKNFQKKWSISLGDSPPKEASKDWKKAQMTLPEWVFYFDIENIRSKYQKPHYFHWILRRALVCGEIRDEDYKTVLIYQTGVHFSSGWFTGLPAQASAFIGVNKETREDELLNVFRKFKKSSAENTYEKYLGVSSFERDTIPNIKRNRKWYWQNLSKALGGEEKSYLEIAKEEAKNKEYNTYLYRDTIAKAIASYKKILNKSLVET